MTETEIIKSRYNAQSILHKAEIRTFINKIDELQYQIKKLETEKEVLMSMIIERQMEEAA